MEDRGRFGGLFKSNDPDLNIPVTGGQSSIVSPYLNIDPRYISQEADQYIFPEGAGHQRGRFEMMFAQIGGSVFAGGALGGANGLYSSVKETKELAGAVKRTQMLNIVAKQGASSAQTLGVVALMYSLLGVTISYLRGADDELNTLTAGTATGLLFKSSAGLKSCLRGGGIGFTAAAIYCAFTSPRIRSLMDK